MWLARGIALIAFMDDRHKPQACSRDGCWPLDILSLKAIKWDEPSFVKQL